MTSLRATTGPRAPRGPSSGARVATPIDDRRAGGAARGRWAAPLIGVLGLLLGLAFVLLPGVARADTWGHYLVVIDDSGSMARNDPRRLVVMAATAMAAALADGDQIAVVGLNELASGELPRFVSPREFLAGSDAAAGSRTLEGPRFDRLGRHAGGTPCRAALTAAQGILEGVAATGAPQTLLLLTDGACNGGAVEPAEGWLGGLRAHRDGRFRFVLLTYDGRERVEPELLRYATLTGWTGESRIRFDARSLLRAFAEVLSFSRGLRYDDGGRVGLERTFAGAREVRALAIAEGGAATIDLLRVSGGAEAPISGGPTFTRPGHGWSLRVAGLAAAADNAPYAVKAATPGVDVLVIPTYGALAVEAAIGPCEPRPPLPWIREAPVRAGQPHCAWARLVGDRGETLVPGRSFAFALDLCEDPACERASAMQPDSDGTFNAQLGPAPERGRHERTFRAHGGALARPVLGRRGFQAVSFGIHSLRRAGSEVALTTVELGELPRATHETLSLEARGAFPAGAEAAITCAIDGDAAIRECLICRPLAPTVALQDPLALQVEVGATPFCPALSDHGGGTQEVGLRLEITPQGEAAATLGPTTLPLSATLKYAASAVQRLSIVGGGVGQQSISVPAPVADSVTLGLTGDDLPSELRLTPATATTRLAGEAAGGRDRLTLGLVAGECCAPGVYSAALRLIAEAGGPALAVPLEITVVDPGFWVCPGQKILRWTLGALGLLTLLWILRGFLSPAKFPPGVVLVYAESHGALSRIGDGDEGWLRLDRFPEIRRGFYRPGTLTLGGARAPLPSLKRMAPSARIEARPGGSSVLIVDGDGTETFSESKGWTALDPGEHIIHSRILLRREGSLYLLFRR